MSSSSSHEQKLLELFEEHDQRVRFAAHLKEWKTIHLTFHHHLRRNKWRRLAKVDDSTQGVLAIHPSTGVAHRFHEMNFEGKEELVQETLILNHRNLIDQSVPLSKTTVDAVGAEFKAAPAAPQPVVPFGLTAPAPPSRKRTSSTTTDEKTEPFCASSMKMTFADVLFSISLYGLACRENVIGPKGVLIHRDAFPVPKRGSNWVEVKSFLELARPLQRRLRRICAQCSPLLRRPEAWPSEKEIRNLEALCAAVVVFHLPKALAGSSPPSTPESWELDEKVFQTLRAWDPPAAIRFRDAEKKKASEAAKRAKELTKKFSQEE